jgi:hypothetical protein
LGLDELFGEKTVLQQRDEHFQGMKPLSVQLGDFNRDGFQDLVIVIKKEERSVVRVLKSVACSARTCKQQDVEAGRRTFEHDSSWDALLNRLPQQIGGVSWIDVDEDVLFSYLMNISFSNQDNPQKHRAHWI